MWRQHIGVVSIEPANAVGIEGNMDEFIIGRLWELRYMEKKVETKNQPE